MKSHIVGTGLLIMAMTASAASEWHSLGNVRMIIQSDQQIVFNCGDAQVQVTPMEDDLVRVRVVRNGKDQDNGSWALAKTDWKLPHHEVKEDSTAFFITLKELQIKVTKHPCRILFLTSDGNIINQDDSSKGMGWDGEDVRVWKTMPENELYYGFGERAGPLERRNTAMTDWNSDTPGYNSGTDPLYESIPFFIGMRDGKCYGIFFDNTFRSSFDMGKESEKYYSFGANGGTIDYYFMYGPDMKKVVERYTEVTGRMNLPPKWAIGYQQCRYSYYPESKVRDIASNFRQRKIPCDVIYLDIDYMDGYRCFTWNKKYFPDPKKMVSDLARDGFKMVVIIDPGLKKDTSYFAYTEGAAVNNFVMNPDGSTFFGKVWPGQCAFPDFVNTRARLWWGSLYKGLVDVGIKGFWNDMNEPSVFDVPGKTIPLDAEDNVDGRIATQAEVHNVYGMQMARGTREGALRLRPDERTFVLTRAGYAGIQRYAASWTGDNISNWEHLGLAIPMCLNFSLSGQPFVGCDIGGFLGSPSGELYARWLEYAVFLPLCRTHTVIGSKDQEPWSYGKEFEAINRKSIELRYQLMPFLYTEFYKTSITGVPIIRPLVMEFPEDKTTYHIDTQFMVGDDLLISPVLEEVSTSRWMYLPSGEWYDFWTHKEIDGGRWLSAPAPIDKVPIFVRAGAVIPMQQVVQYTDQEPIDPLTYEIFPSTQAKGLLYEDDGISFNYQKGISRTVGIKVAVADSEINIEQSAPEGDYVPAHRSVIFAVNGLKMHPISVTVNGNKIGEVHSLEGVTEGWIFDNGMQRLSVKTDDTNTAFDIHIRK
jgi:alpha-glucosidase